MDTSTWTGAAADAFRAKYALQPGKRRDASTASGDASEALGSYAGAVEWAQGQARPLPHPGDTGGGNGWTTRVPIPYRGRCEFADAKDVFFRSAYSGQGNERSPKSRHAPIHGRQPYGRQRGVERAANLSEFRVPTRRLIEPSPTSSLSISEGQRLRLGPDLGKYLVKTIPNPFGLEGPPPSFGAG
jgi:hypothetical protein